MIILVLNCGSSSIKYQLFDFSDASSPVLLCKGLVERIGADDAIFTHRPRVGGRPEYRWEGRIGDHREGVTLLLGALADVEHGVIDSLDGISAVGHRVVHGGSLFTESVLITPESEAQIEECCLFAPLHNPANLLGIRVVSELLPGKPSVAVFDTAFHQTLPAEAFMYALPYHYYPEMGIRKYGFHGTSDRFVSAAAASFLGCPLEELRLISCHLGNGASVAAIASGKSVDTSMGFTPVDGLVMGTRCGDVDPGVLLTIARKEGRDLDGIDDLINRESGLKGVSGVSNDMRELEAASEAGNELATLAREMFVYRVVKYIGAYTAVMGGVDAILFTGGIGENAGDIRSMVCDRLGFLGAAYDAELNARSRGELVEISTAESGVRLLVVPTDEERLIAADTYALCHR